MYEEKIMSDEVEIEKIREMVIDSLEKDEIGVIAFDINDAPKIEQVLRDKVYLQMSDSEGYDEIAVEEKIHSVDIQGCMNQASYEATGIARSVMATIIIADMIDELTIDLTVEKSDNKVVKTVSKKFLEAYPQLMTASETAGQQILEKILDKEIENVKDS
jgi:hypothetical protein